MEGVNDRVSGVDEALENWDPILRKEAERRISERLRKVAIEGCQEEIRAFAECARGKMMAVVWDCRAENRVAKSCMQRFKENEKMRLELRREHARTYPRSVTGWERKNDSSSDT